MPLFTGTDLYNTDTGLKLNQLFAYSLPQRKGRALHFLTTRGYGQGVGEPGSAEEAGLPSVDSQISSGAYANEWKFTSTLNGATQNPNATYSLALAGNQQPAYEAMRITPTDKYYTVNMPIQLIQNSEAGSMTYVQRMAQSMRDLHTVRVLARSKSLYTASGAGRRMGTVVSSDTINSASAVFNVTVDNGRGWPVGMEFEFRTTSGAVIASSVVMKINSCPNAPGEGVITVSASDPGGTVPNFTPAAGDVLVPVGAYAAGASTEISDEVPFDLMISDSAFPRAGFSNTPLDTPRWKSYVGTDNGTPDYKMLDRFVENVRLNASSEQVVGSGGDPMRLDSAQLKDITGRTGGYAAARTFLIMNTQIVRNLAYTFRDTKTNNYTSAPSFYSEGAMIDEGVRYDKFQGIPILTDDIAPLTRIYYVNFGCIYHLVRIPIGPLPKTPLDFVRQTGSSTLYCLNEMECDTFVPVGRNGLGRLNGDNLAAPLTGTS